MTAIGMNDNDQNLLRDFLLMTQNTRRTQDEQKSFFTLISPSLRLRVQNQAFYDVLVLNSCINKFLIQLKTKSIKHMKSAGLS